ncbi:7tm-1 domain-containing protein, partial [Pyrenophora tritici-repentis]
NEAGLKDLVSALTCVGGCQVPVNQSWVFINFLLFLIPTLVMITVYSKIFLIAKQQAQNIEKMSKQTARASESYKDRVTKRERKAAKTLGIAVAAFLLSWLPYFIDSFIDAFLGFITPT